jgi:hypothetical protein
MLVDYTSGFSQTVWISILIAVPSFVLTIAAIIEALKSLFEDKFSLSMNIEGVDFDLGFLGLLTSLLVRLFGLFFCLAITAGVAVSALIFLFPIVNFLLQPWWSTEFYSHEISNGALGLRVTSVLLARKAFMSLMTETPLSYQSFINGFSKQKANKTSWLSNKFLNPQFLAKKNHVDLSGTCELKPVKNSSTITTIQAFQNVFYVCILFSLWFFLITNTSSIWSRSASWLLFFIADDWAIISDYYSILKGRIFKPHLTRLLVTNIALYLLCSLGYLNQLSLWVSTLFVVICGLILLTELTFLLLDASISEREA